MKHPDLDRFHVELRGPIDQWELHYTSIVNEMNQTPLFVQPNQLMEELKVAGSRLRRTFQDCFDLTGIQKPGSSAQVAQFMDRYGVEPVKWTDRARTRISWDKDAIAQVADQGIKAEVQSILDARDARAELSQLEKLAEYMHKIQPQWNQFGTPMGRLSCEGFAVQNRIPQVRRCIVPAEGHTYISADLGMAEYTMWANLSQDPMLLRCLGKDRDVHTEMGYRVGHLMPSWNSRQLGKRTNFSILYLTSAFGLHKSLRCDLDIADAILSTARMAATQGFDYMDSYLAKASRLGRAWTSFGRWRRIPDLQKNVKSAQWREASKTAWHHHNSGTCADAMKIMSVMLDDALEDCQLRHRVRFAMNLHDEVILEVPSDDSTVEHVSQIMQDVFSTPLKDNWLPFRVDVKSGPNWHEVSK